MYVYIVGYHFRNNSSAITQCPLELEDQQPIESQRVPYTYTCNLSVVVCVCDR